MLEMVTTMKKSIKEAIERGYKVCRTCGIVKAIDDFYKREDKCKGGGTYISYRNDCKDCVKAKIRLRETGWDPHTYERTWCLQEGKCAICGCDLNSSRYTKAAADHDHKSGKLRGILCNNCNAAIGLMKDSPYRLENAIRYLEEHGCHC
jgi:hypothetical protein